MARPGAMPRLVRTAWTTLAGAAPAAGSEAAPERVEAYSRLGLPGRPPPPSAGQSARPQAGRAAESIPLTRAELVQRQRLPQRAVPGLRTPGANRARAPTSWRTVASGPALAGSDHRQGSCQGFEADPPACCARALRLGASGRCCRLAGPARNAALGCWPDSSRLVLSMLAGAKPQAGPLMVQARLSGPLSAACCGMYRGEAAKAWGWGMCMAWPA